MTASTLPDTTRLFIDGSWVLPSSTAQLSVFNPETEQLIARVPSGTPEDVDSAVRAARAAFSSWSVTTPAYRASILSELKCLLESKRSELVELIVSEVGTPARVADSVQVGLPIAVLESYIELLGTYEFRRRVGASIVMREPVGVVAAITPWNYPLHQSVAKVIPALAAGCTVVHKPSEIAPLTAFVLADLLDRAGLPQGVFNLVCGTGAEVGDPLVRHPDVDMVSFTGSTDTGRRIGAAAADTVKRVTLELGGKSANVILDDADLQVAVPAGVKNAFLNSGQTCTALSRMLVPRDRYDEALAIAVETAEKLEPRLGPVATEAQWERVQGYLEIALAEGARLATGGLGRPRGRDTGYFCRATVLADVTPDMRVAQEEIFGPVLCVIPYVDEDDAVRIANGTPYGLAAGVWSSSEERALRVAARLRAGQVDLNGAAFNLRAPFGGYGRSGNGRELGEFGLEEFLEIKSVQL